jgi:hypothetical protein
MDPFPFNTFILFPGDIVAGVYEDELFPMGIYPEVGANCDPVPPFDTPKTELH